MAEDIHERSFRFACEIVRLHQRLSRGKRTPAAIAMQLLKAGTSMGANLEEAKAGQSRADFLSKCRIALKEGREAHYWLRLLKASDSCNEDLSPLVDEANQLVAILTTIIKKASFSIIRK
ncbi:MAG TPA: four helix bundle protein [Thermoanaerobaculia bacterium]|nr:four helix bundle protein [Thermoanaerobaculia bacterium]